MKKNREDNASLTGPEDLSQYRLLVGQIDIVGGFSRSVGAVQHLAVLGVAQEDLHDALRNKCFFVIFIIYCEESPRFNI